MGRRFVPTQGSCLGKVPHGSQAEARAAVVSTHDRTGPRKGEVSVYLCGMCGHWHWGHVPRTRLTQRRSPTYSRRPKHRLQEFDE